MGNFWSFTERLDPRARHIGAALRLNPDRGRDIKLMSVFKWSDLMYKGTMGFAQLKEVTRDAFTLGDYLGAHIFARYVSSKGSIGFIIKSWRISYIIWCGDLSVHLVGRVLHAT